MTFCIQLKFVFAKKIKNAMPKTVFSHVYTYYASTKISN